MCNLRVRQFSIPLQHWIANNIFGLAFSLNGVELLHLNTVTTGCILLGGLFVYDIFWVCTSVSEEILDEKTLLRVTESDSLFTHIPLRKLSLYPSQFCFCRCNPNSKFLSSFPSVFFWSLFLTSSPLQPSLFNLLHLVLLTSPLYPPSHPNSPFLTTPFLEVLCRK